VAGADVRFDLHVDPGVTADGLVRLAFPGPGRELHFAIDPAGHRIWAKWTEPPPRESMDGLASLLLGPVLGGVLRLRGTVSLHGCVLEVGSRAVVVLGGRGAGKSTLAAAMAGRGAAVLSDDVAALVERPRGSWTAEPGYPRLRLRPGTVEAIGTPATPAAEVGLVFAGGEKRFFQLSDGEGVGPWRFQPRPLPLGVVYELHRDAAVPGPGIEDVAGADGLAALVRHVRAAVGPVDRAARAAELTRLGRLAAAVPVRRLSCPDDLEALPDVCRALVDDALLAGRA
jgi:hypothetical protein